MIETVFTPWMSLAGGLLIGLAAVLLMGGIGRVLGVSGIFGGILMPDAPGDRTWRVAVIAGMVSAPIAFSLFTGEMPIIQIPVSIPMLIVGGALVGVGATLGSGCTSGHGICGLARLSPRSVVATLTFMLTTAVTVYVIRHVLGS